jgi:LPXTG-site transpeptidase (sortase) family protein
MRAGAPGIAFRFRPVESSPVGPRTPAAPRRGGRVSLLAAGIALALVVLLFALAGGAARLEGIGEVRAAPAAGRAAAAWARRDPGSVARLVVPERHIDVALPAHASRRERGAGPGQTGNVVVAAGRDESMRFLRRVEVGDAVIVESRHGERLHYRVRDVRIVDRGEVSAAPPPSEPTLTLVTSYPLRSLPAEAALLYVVVATVDRGTV